MQQRSDSGAHSSGAEGGQGRGPEPAFGISDPARPFACDACADRFSSRNKLFQHIRQKHRDAPEDSLEAISEYAPNSAPDGHGGPVGPEVGPAAAVLWEDHWVRALVKPQGTATMGERGSLLKSDALLLSAADVARGDVKKAIPAHRLDKDTGGIVLCSKTKAVDAFLKRQFMERTVSKRYMAVVVGKVEPSRGSIDLPLAGQASCTRFEVLGCSPSRQFGWLTTLNLWPVTGRMHQLRRHMQMIGHHIVGERRYASSLDLPHDPYNRPSSGEAAGEGSGSAGLLYLWAVEISFPHPALTDEGGGPRMITLSLPEVPPSFDRLCAAEAAGAAVCGKRPRADQEGAAGGEGAS